VSTKRQTDFWDDILELRDEGLDDFEGVFYVWRGKRDPETLYPSNIKLKFRILYISANLLL
jgi:hypothetical protein